MMGCGHVANVIERHAHLTKNYDIGSICTMHSINPYALRSTILLVLLVILTGIPDALRGQQELYELQWEVGSGEALSIGWATEDEYLFVYTTRGVDLLNRELDHRRQIVDATNIINRDTTIVDARGVTYAFRGDLWAWDEKTETLSLFENMGFISAYARQPNYNQVIVSTRDVITQQDHLTLWDIETQQVITTFSEEGMRVRSLAWQPHGQKLAVGFVDGEVWIYKFDSNRFTIEHIVPIDSPQSLAWRNDGQILAISSFDIPSLTLWDMTSHRILSETSIPDLGGKLAWNQSDQYLAGRDVDGNLVVWNYEVNSQFQFDYTPQSIADYAFSQNLLGVLMHDGGIDLWEISSNGLRLISSSEAIYTGEVEDFAVDHSSMRVAVMFQSDIRITLFDADGSRFRTITPISPVAPSDFSDIGWSIDGRWLAVSYHNYIEIWDFHTGVNEPTVIVYSGRMPKLAWHPREEHQLWVAWGNDNGRSLIQIDAIEGTIIHNIHIDNLTELLWRSDGQVAALSRHSPFRIELFNPHSLTIITSLAGDELPDSRVFDWLPESTDLFSIQCFEGIETCAYWIWSEDQIVIQPNTAEGALAQHTPITFAMSPNSETLALSLGVEPGLYILDADGLSTRIQISEFVFSPQNIIWTNERTLYVSDGVLKVISIP